MPHYVELDIKAARDADATDARLTAAGFAVAIRACGPMTHTTHLFRS
ncbi:hypothetical protein [Cupriavidus necator]|nr:hypothetical protein [Cupriavidus necator]